MNRMITCTTCESNILENNDEISVLKCDICKSDFCLSCFPLSNAELRVIPLKERLLMVCCVTCKTAMLSSLLNAEKLYHMEEEKALLKANMQDKDIIIADKNEIIQLLKSHQQVSGDNHNQYLLTSSPVKVPQITQEKHNDKEITLTQVNRAVHSAMIQSTNKDDHKSQKSAKKKKSSSVIAAPSFNSGEPSKFQQPEQILPLIGVPQKKWYHVRQVSENSSENSVKTYLLSKLEVPDNEEVIVRSLNTSGQTNSYKVGINTIHSTQIESTNFWPENIICRNFIFKNRTENQHFRKNFRRSSDQR